LEQVFNRVKKDGYVERQEGARGEGKPWEDGDQKKERDPDSVPITKAVKGSTTRLGRSRKKITGRKSRGVNRGGDGPKGLCA